MRVLRSYLALVALLTDLSRRAASPHVINSMLDAIEAMRVALGPGIVLQHVLQGLFHPARKVREVRRSLRSSYLDFCDRC